MDNIIYTEELKSVINKVNHYISTSDVCLSELKSTISSANGYYKTNNTGKLSSTANEVHNNLKNINSNSRNDVTVISNTIQKYTAAEKKSTDYLNNILLNVIENVQKVAKNKSVVNQATNVINDKISLVKKALNMEKADGYQASSYAEVKNGIIFGKNKPGESSRLYLHNSDGSLNGIINLNANEAIKNINYNNENNQVVVETIDGEKQTYDINRIERSIELNKNYEGPDIGKYYATDGEKVVEAASKEQGKPYAWGASGPDSYDCSGLVAYALTGKHERLGATGEWLNHPEIWTPTDNPEPGDVCLSSHHTGIYVGDGHMIHAPDFNQPVQIGPVQSDMIYVKYNG